jgi:hypothetical protein
VAAVPVLLLWALLLLVLAAPIAWKRWRGAPAARIAYEARLGVRLLLGISFFAFLGFAMFEAALNLAVSAPLTRRILVVRRFASEEVADKLRTGLLPFLPGIGRSVTLSDRLFDHREGNPNWPLWFSVVTAMVALLVVQVVFALVGRNYFLGILIGLALALGAAVALLLFGRSAFAAASRALLALARRRVRVRAPSDVDAARRAASGFFGALVRLSPLPPMLTIDCTDETWQGTVSAIMPLVEIVIVAGRSTETDNLRWEIALAEQLGIRVLHDPSVDELAQALRSS